MCQLGKLYFFKANHDVAACLFPTQLGVLQATLDVYKSVEMDLREQDGTKIDCVRFC
jgi:hypothetical protein